MAGIRWRSASRGDCTPCRVVSGEEGLCEGWNGVGAALAYSTGALKRSILARTRIQAW